MFLNKKVQFCVLVTLVLLIACSQSKRSKIIPQTATFNKVNIRTLPGWNLDQTVKALPALFRSCKAILKKRNWYISNSNPPSHRLLNWAEVCERLPKKGTGELNFRQYLISNFNVFKVETKTEKRGLFTGYYEPELRGSTKKTLRYATAIYPQPNNLIKVNLRNWKEISKNAQIVGRIVGDKLKPYFSRAEITEGALSKSVPTLLWLESEIDAFFLHIQGSGKIMLPDGSIVRLGYAAKNGHRYFPIGRYLLRIGAIPKEELSLQSIRRWLIANPSQQKTVMNMNPSYIFFRKIYGEGPIGSQGVPLTRGRSLAVDPQFVPLGAPVWVAVDYTDEKRQKLNRLMVAQDTGGAIKGPVRGDFFWGSGKLAEKYAGSMKAFGYLYLFLPKTVDPG